MVELCERRVGLRPRAAMSEQDLEVVLAPSRVVACPPPDSVLIGSRVLHHEARRFPEFRDQHIKSDLFDRYIGLHLASKPDWTFGPPSRVDDTDGVAIDPGAEDREVAVVRLCCWCALQDEAEDGLGPRCVGHDRHANRTVAESHHLSGMIGLRPDSSMVR